MIRCLINLACLLFVVAGLSACSGGGGGGGAPAPTYTVGVTVSGLTGSGLVLQDNGGDDLSISTDGSFTFATAIPDGSAYSVTVLSNPTGPNQICAVSSGAGSVSGGNVTSVTVSCATNAYIIGGAVSGLNGSGLTLRDNGGDDLSISADGSFTFATAIADGSAYNVTVLSNPTSPSQSCTVSSGAGSVSGGNVTGVTVTCTTNVYTIGGTVSGLTGSGLTLRDNGGDDLPISADGSFTFATAIADGSAYNVTVLSNPASPNQICTVSSGAGSVSGGTVTGIAVTCTNTYTIGGAVSGLTGAGLVLQDNGGDDLPISADGSFTFATAIADGSAYNVTILTQPTGQTCTATSNTGIVSAGNITNVGLTCVESVVLDANPLSRVVSLSWNDIGAISYDLYRSTDPACDFNNIGACADGTVTAGVSSPYAAAGLTNGTAYYFVLKANLSGAAVSVSNTAVSRPDVLVVNRSVNAIATAADGTAYLGGTFTLIGALSGGGVPLSTAAVGLGIGGYPTVTGTVNAAVPDGSGGFYIGGSFTQVGGVARNNIAHILADGSVSAWDPNANNSVYTLAVSGSTVYAGGVFTTIGGATRNYIAALDASTNTNNATAWDPDADNTVYTLAVSGGTVYTGGLFTTIGGATRNYIAALDAATNTNNATAWDPNANNTVYTLAVSGSTVYAGGAFLAIGGATRNYIAALNATTNTNNATPWVPSANNLVYALTVSADGSTVYAGGLFTAIGGASRSRIAALDAVANTNNATAWNPNADNWVYALAVSADGSTVYAGGTFTTIGGATRKYIAALDAATNTNNATAWDPNANNSVYALALSASTVYAGGNFTSIGGATRNYIAAVGADGTLTAWDPNADTSVSTLAVSGSTVYAGGFFTNIGGAARNYIAALDATTNTYNATAWDPNANNLVSTLAVSADGSTVYAGGNFTGIGGAVRNYIAALDAATDTNNATAWDPNADNTVNALAVYGSTVYAGGLFTAIGGASRSYIAALDAATNTNNATAWDPHADNQVLTLAVTADGSTVYAGGDFSTIGGASRSHIAAVDATTSNAIAWDPNANNRVNALAVSADGSTVYAGGTFTDIDGAGASNFAILAP